MKYIIIFLLSLLFFPSQGQVIIDSDRHKKNLDTITYTDVIPEDLLNGKSVIIHTGEYIDMARAAKQLQPGMKKAGVDAVAHYYFEDVFSGIDAMAKYKDQLNSREIKFLIYYSPDSIHRLIIVPYNGEDFFTGPAFRMEHEKLDVLLNNLYLQAERSSLKRLNLLILDVPAFAEYPKIIEGRRAEFYDLNMKSGKVAIPKTPDSVLNKSIDSVMAAYYPYNYGFVEPDISTADLRKEGYWFLLYGIHGPGKTVKKLLEYPTSEETAYASIVADGNETEVKTIDVNKSVYKFYIKHVQSSDVFLGKHYDADESWAVALKKYILNLRNILDR